MISYRVDAEDVHAHLFRVTLRVPSPAAQQRLSLPVWIPGSYLVREFARHLSDLQATQGGRPVPLAVTGALLLLFIARSTINLYSQIGMILLIGLVTKNSILLVEYANQLKARGLSTVEAMLESGRIRLRPILMTSVSTVMGAVPIMLGLGAGSISRRPLGYAIVGGILFSTVLTLFLVPVAYVLLDTVRDRVRRRRDVLVPVEGD